MATQVLPKNDSTETTGSNIAGRRLDKTASDGDPEGGILHDPSRADTA